VGSARHTQGGARITFGVGRRLTGPERVERMLLLPLTVTARPVARGQRRKARSMFDTMTTRWMVALAAAGVLGGAAPALAQSAPVVMAQGLDNPRGMAIGPDNAIYVVEAGRGGTSNLCLPVPNASGQRCYGPSGAVTRITAPGVQLRVLGGLPSVAVPSGADATGPHDIDFGFGHAFITVGSGGDPALLAPFKQAGVSLGSLLMVSYTGAITPIADIAAYEASANPDGGHPDSNAYSLDIQTDRGVLTDAGGNSLLQILPDLSVSALAVFPARTVAGPGGAPIDMETVPTAVVEGPDRSLYVGELTGFPFPVDGARVYRVPASGGAPQVVATGFTNIIDLAIGPDGAAYVLEHDINGLATAGSIGRLTRIGPFGERSEIAAGLLTAPGNVLIGPDNSIYVSVNSTSAGNGQVWRLSR
jgi:hypothetical protein